MNELAPESSIVVVPFLTRPTPFAWTAGVKNTSSELSGSTIGTAIFRMPVPSARRLCETPVILMVRVVGPGGSPESPIMDMPVSVPMGCVMSDRISPVMVRVGDEAGKNESPGKLSMR